jgi:hypothetical protein
MHFHPPDCGERSGGRSGRWQHNDRPADVDIGEPCLDCLTSAVVGPKVALAPRDVLVLVSPPHDA